MVFFKILILLALPFSAMSSELEYSEYESIESDQYLYKMFGKKKGNKAIDFGGIDLRGSVKLNSSCGDIDFKASLDSNMQSLINVNGAEISRLGKQILSKAPLLSICYMSPAACAQLKHFEKQASKILNARIDQCQIIENYVDDRSSIYKKQKAQCVQDNIARNGGNIDEAFKVCKSRNNSNETPDWTGKNERKTNNEARLIEHSKRWANIKNMETSKSIDLAIKLVGDDIYKDGKSYTEFGGDPKSLEQLEEEISVPLGILLVKLTNRIYEKRKYSKIYQITDQQIDELNKNLIERYFDKRFVEDLSFITPVKRNELIINFSQKVAKNTVKRRIKQAIGILPKLASNPNLDSTQKKAIYKKMSLLKSYSPNSINNTNENIRDVFFKTNSKAVNSKNSKISRSQIFNKKEEIQNSFRNIVFDCSDPLFCKN